MSKNIGTTAKKLFIILNAIAMICTSAPTFTVFAEEQVPTLEPETLTALEETEPSPRGKVLDITNEDEVIVINSDAEAMEESEAEAPAEEVAEPVSLYSQEDYEYLVMLLTGECQNLNRDAQIAVGSVILNRVASPKYPNTVKAVALQKGQYSCMRDGNAYRTPTPLTIEVAQFLVANGSQLEAGYVFQSQSKQTKDGFKIANEWICR